MYYTTLLYYGRMLSTEAYQRISAVISTVENARFILKVAKDRWILFAPGRKVSVGTIDPILDLHEKRDGRVARNEVDEWFAMNAGHKAEWNSTTESDLARLTELVVVAAGGHNQTEKPGTYICEICWSTLDQHDDGSIVTYNIRVE